MIRRVSHTRQNSPSRSSVNRYRTATAVDPANTPT